MRLVALRVCVSALTATVVWQLVRATLIFRDVEERGSVRPCSPCTFQPTLRPEPVTKELRDLIHDLFCIGLAADCAQSGGE